MDHGLSPNAELWEELRRVVEAGRPLVLSPSEDAAKSNFIRRIPEPMDRLFATSVASHEAGHAVAGVLLGAEVVRVTLHPDRPDANGVVEFSAVPPPLATSAALFATAVRSFGEIRWDFESLERAHQRGGAADGWWDALLADTREMVQRDDFRHGLVAVSRALTRRSELTGEEVVEIVGQALGAMKGPRSVTLVGRPRRGPPGPGGLAAGRPAGSGPGVRTGALLDAPVLS